jgi:hypothetical protein
VSLSNLRCGDGSEPGDVVWVTAYVSWLYDCAPCPPGAVCGPCPPPHVMVAEPGSADSVPIWWEVGGDYGEGRTSRSEPKDFVVGQRYAFECRVVSCNGGKQGELVYLSHRRGGE